MNPFFDFLLTLALSFIASATAYAVARFVFSSSPRAARIAPRRADRAFGLIALGYTVLLAYLSIVRFLAFKMGDHFINSGYDLAQYDQMIWNSLHGRLLENTILFDAPMFLGKSFTPILLALVPLYAVWQNPIILLVTQTIMLALSAFPIYWFARSKLGGALAVIFSLAWFLSPGLLNMNLHEFHDTPLMTLTLAFAGYFLLRRRYVGFLVCLGLALLVKEEVALIAAMLGVYIIAIQRQRRLGAAIFVFGLVWFILVLQFIIPFFRGTAPGTGFYYFESGSIAGGASRYGYLGRNLPEIIVTLFTRPDIVLPRVFIPEKIAYVLQLLVPLAFLPLIGLDVALIALPTLGYSLLSMFSAQYSIYFSYYAPILPVLFFAAIVGAERLIAFRATRDYSSEKMARRWAVAALIFTASMVSYFLQAPGPFARQFQAERYQVTDHAQIGMTLTDSIPPTATVSTQMDLLAHLSNRRFIYEIPWTPDYRQVDYLVADTTSSWYEPHRKIWDAFFATDYFDIQTRQDGFIVAKRRAIEPSLQIRFGDAMTLLGFTIPPTAALRGGTTLRPIVAWRNDKLITEPYSMTVQVIDTRGHIWAMVETEPQAGKLPTTRWEIGKEIGDQYAIDLPPTMPAGDYQLELMVRQAKGEMLPAIDARGNRLDSPVVITPLKIEKDTRSYQASDLWWLEKLLFVDMRDLRFLGYVPPPEKIVAGETLSVGLYWRARSKPQGDYVVVVQLRDANGRVSLEQVNRPADDSYPTTKWSAGEVLLDWHDVALPSTLARGEYRMVVLLRESTSHELLGQAELGMIVVE